VWSSSSIQACSSSRATITDTNKQLTQTINLKSKGQLICVSCLFVSVIIALVLLQNIALLLASTESSKKKDARKKTHETVAAWHPKERYRRHVRR
jgi:hypothetical protein